MKVALTCSCFAIATWVSHSYVLVRPNHRKPIASFPPPFSMTARSGKQPAIDPTKAIKQAIEATKIYGATSYKARMAWEVVEKIDYSRKTPSKRLGKQKESSPANADGSNEILPRGFADVEDSVRDLKFMLDNETTKVNHLKDMLFEIKETKEKSRTTHKAKSIEAIAAAHEAARQYGVASPETLFLWKAVEEEIMSGLAP